MLSRLSPLLFACVLWAQLPHNGAPSGIAEQRASGAPAELDHAAFFIGQYDVTIAGTDEKEPATTAMARFDWMLRGHGIMGRFTAEAFRGKPWSTLSFMVFNKATGLWGEGIADSRRLDVRIFSGRLEDKKLVLYNVVRPQGGLTLTTHRNTYTPTESGGFRYERAASNDMGTTWKTELQMTFTPRKAAPGFLDGDGRLGQPNPARPAPAAENDFLIGNWSATHQMTFPNGQKAGWTSRANAVYCLDGHGVMEYSAFDTDPNLPDAATSIIRVYNPAMERWESLYTTNRSHGLLHFGGTWRDDRMALTLFENNASDSAMNHFVFHDIKKDSYHWYAERSNDGGNTYQKYWLIDFKRLPGQK